MIQTLSILFVFVLFHSAILGKAFHIYSPSSKENTLWIVKATPKGESLKLEVAEKVKFDFSGRVITQQASSLYHRHRWGSRQSTGSSRILKQGWFLPKTSEH